MAHTPSSSGPTGPHFIRMPSLDERANARATHSTGDKHSRTSLPRTPAAYAHPVPHSLSPPHDSDTNHYFGNTIPPNLEHGLPHTPPRQEDIFQLLQTWNEQHQKDHHASTPTVRHDRTDLPCISQHQQPNATNQHYTNGHSDTIGSSDEDVFMSQESYVPSVRNAPSHGYRAGDATAPLPVDSGRNSGSLFYHTSTQPPSDAPSMQQPPIQQWPTNQLGNASRKMPPPQDRARSLSDAAAIGLSPGHDGVTPPDEKVLQKAEAYRRKGAEMRQRRQSLADAKPPRRNPSAPRSAKRKPSIQPLDTVSPTVPPFLRHPPPSFGRPSRYTPGYGNPVPHVAPHLYDTRTFNQDAHNTNMYTPSLAHQQSIYHTPKGLPLMIPSPLQGQPSQPFQMSYPFRLPPSFQYDRMGHPAPRPNAPTAYPYAEMGMGESTPWPSPALPVIPKPFDWDTLAQEIVPLYENYKWPVTHYEVVSSGTYGSYDFAQSWLDDLYASNDLLGPRSKWHTHSTQGFIEGGTRTSFIVLHNAVDPFEWGDPPSSTTSIGVYGHNWYEHSTIHWTTFAPDIRALLQYCENQARNIRVKQKWTINMTKASEKRFHRAYWLAATRNHLKGILNRGPSDDVPHDAVEDDEEFYVTEEDLTNEWDITFEESEEAWKRVKEQVEEMGHVCMTGQDHVVTGSSEWD
jgi:hypothetical protein